MKILQLGLVGLNHGHSVVKVNRGQVHGLEYSLRRLYSIGGLLLRNTGAIVHIKENGLRVVEAWIIIRPLRRLVVILFLQLFVEVLDEFDLHFLVNAVERHRLVQCLLQLLGLILDVQILVLDLSLDALHVRFDVVDVLNPLVGCLIRNIVEDAEDLTILLLQVLHHLMHLLVLSSEFEQVARVLHILELVAEQFNELLDVSVELVADFHETLPDSLFPSFYNGCIFDI